MMGLKILHRSIPERPEVAIFRQKMLQIMATFPPICKSFALFFAKLPKCGLLLCQNSDFGIFWNFLATSGNTIWQLWSIHQSPWIFSSLPWRAFMWRLIFETFFINKIHLGPIFRAPYTILAPSCTFLHTLGTLGLTLILRTLVPSGHPAV